MHAGWKRGLGLGMGVALLVATMACEDDTIGDREDPLGSGGMTEGATGGTATSDEGTGGADQEP